MNSLIVIVVAVVLTLFVSVVIAAPKYENDVKILRYVNDNDGLGSYSFQLYQSDGTRREEKGELKNKGSDNESIVVVGKYSWEAPDGTIYVVSYTADENGYHPTIQKIQFQQPEVVVAHPPSLVASLLG